MLTTPRRPARLLATALVATALTGPAAASATTTRAAPTGSTVTAVGAGVPLAGYQLQSTAATNDTGAAVSQPGYAATGWVPAGPRSTVLAALLQQHRYADPFYSTNMKNIPASDFTVPWWYRSEFTLADAPGIRTFLDFSGVIAKADVYVDGTQVASSTQVAGAYTHQELDVTSLVHAGTNAVAFKVYPNNPDRDLTTGWIDWVQNPPDHNMGIFRDVVVRRNGGVSLRGGHVLTSLNGALTQATLTAKVDARNDTAAAVTATIAGQVAGVNISSSVSLAAHETKTVTFGAVTLPSPQLWWPAGMGGQPLYDLNLSATAGGTVTDTAHERFGVRSVTAVLDASGHRAYRINGRPLLIKGGGWSPDLFLRWDPASVEDKIRYTLDLGLNTIRLEGHLEPDEFFEMTDRLGVLTLPGWECCDKWEGNVNGGEPGDTWGSADFVIAKNSMAAEAARLRNHPSVISFLIGSDFAPSATIEKNYLDALHAADWPTPIIAAASDNSSPTLGSSGMKMTGPYDWVPPNYWYNKREGGAFGFNSETSAGPDVPTLDTLRRMMTPAELDTLWKNPTSTQYHRSPSSTFSTLGIFNKAMTGRYGTPASLDDYVRKAQLQQYENVRAQFESYGRNFKDASNPSTGVIYWMLNSGWTSLHWQLFDRYMDQNGAYYGAKKANEPLHIQYSYDNKSVVVVNSRPGTASGLTARTTVYNIDGTQLYTNTATGLSVAGGGGSTTAVTIPAISGLSSTYLVKLTLTDSAGQELSRNVYWLSTADDVIDYANNDWYYAPTTSYANLKGLAGMPTAPITASATSTTGTDTTTTTVTLRNTGTAKTPALYVDAHILGTNAAPVLPVTWNDNAVSLWPGESTTLTATYRTADLHGATPNVRVSGWNVTTQTVPTTSGPTRLEAETATISQGTVDSNHLNFSGTGFANCDNVAGSYVQWTVNAATTGPATLTIRYSNGTTTNRPADITVNGTVISATHAFPSTTNWDTWANTTLPVNLTAGTNTIRVTATTANGPANLDYIELT